MTCGGVMTPVSRRLRRTLVTAAVLLILPAAAASSAHATVPGDFVGIASEDSFAGNLDYRNTNFAAQRAAGIGLVRQTMDWSIIEQGGTFNFAGYDSFVGAAASNGLNVMPILFRAPEAKSRAPKKRKKGDRATYPPKRNGDFAKFAKAAAQRYGPNGSFWMQNPTIPKRPITVWQLWNEPNLPVYWGGKPNAREYVKFQAAGAKAIKSVDKRAEILTAGLPDSRNSKPPLDRYIAQLYRAGGKGAFDILAINGYNKTAAGAIQKLKSIRNLMDDQGDKGGKMWVTEIGWADRGPPCPYNIGAAGQAREAASLLRLSAASRSKLKLRGVVYYTWKDLAIYGGFGDFCGLHTGLSNIDGVNIVGVAKPALASFSQAAAEIK